MYPRPGYRSRQNPHRPHSRPERNPRPWSNPEKEESSPTGQAGDDEHTWQCIVCCSKVPSLKERYDPGTSQAIYAIGLCDHTVCYECATRSRVLCKQKECPICRQELPQVRTRDRSSVLLSSMN